MILATATALPPMTEKMIRNVKYLELLSKHEVQENIPVNHYLHGGMYVRTVKIPAGVMITGAHIKIPTNLVINGHAMIYTGWDWIENKGYNVLPALPNRKQIFVAITDVDLTMFFPTDAKTVTEAEERFTSEAHLLQNREAECQA